MRVESVYDKIAQAAQAVTTSYPVILLYPPDIAKFNSVRIDAVSDDPSVRPLHEREFVMVTTRQGDGGLRAEEPVLEFAYLNVHHFETKRGGEKEPGCVKATPMILSYCKACDVAWRMPLGEFNHKRGSYKSVICPRLVEARAQDGTPIVENGSPKMIQCRTPLVKAKKVIDPAITPEVIARIKELYHQGPTPETMVTDLPRIYSVVRKGKHLWTGTPYEQAVRARYQEGSGQGDGKDLVRYADTGKIGEQPFAHVMTLPPVCGWVTVQAMSPDDNLGYYSNFRLEYGLKIV